MNNDKRDAVEAKVLNDHRAHVGKVILSTSIQGYRNDDHFDLVLKTPAIVRVDPMCEQDLFIWDDNEHCDSYWDVTLLAPHPELEGFSSLWIDGPTHTIYGTQEPVGWQLASSHDKLLGRLNGFVVFARARVAAYLGDLQRAIQPWPVRERRPKDAKNK